MSVGQIQLFHFCSDFMIKTNRTLNKIRNNISRTNQQHTLFSLSSCFGALGCRNVQDGTRVSCQESVRKRRNNLTTLYYKMLLISLMWLLRKRSFKNIWWGGWWYSTMPAPVIQCVCVSRCATPTHFTAVCPGLGSSSELVANISLIHNRESYLNM